MSIVRVTYAIIYNMKNSILSSRQTATAVLTGIFTRELPFLMALAALLAQQPNLRAGTTYWDPDNDPSNNDVSGPGTGALGSLSLSIGPINWESANWTDDSNLPLSITNTLVNFNEGDDAIFWGIQAIGTTPDIALMLNAPHTVKSLSFYSTLSAGVTWNYWLIGGGPNNLTNTSGVINCDGGAAANAASTLALNTTLQVPLVTTNGLQTHGNGTTVFTTNMLISGGPIVLSGFTRPGSPGGIKLPNATQWNTAANGGYQPFPLNSQIILTNGAALTLNGTAVTSSVPIVIWDGNISGAGGLYAPQYVVKVCRYGNNTLAEVLNDDGTGTTTLLKTGAESFGFTTTANSYKGGTIISQGAIQWFQAASGATPPATATSCLGTNTITMGDTNTGNWDIGLIRTSTAPSTASTNMWNNIVVTTNGTGRVFIGNQAMAGIVRMSGTISLGRTAYFGGSGTANQGLTYYSSGTGGRGTLFDGAISGAGGVVVGNVTSTLFSTTAADLAAGGYNTGATWFEGGSVKLTNPNNSYAGGSSVYWGTLEAAANGSLGTGNATVIGPGILLLDTSAAIASTANLIMGTNSLTPAGSNAVVNLNYSGTCNINALSTNGGLSYVAAGTWGAVGSVAANQSALFIGTGILNVVNPSTNTTTTLASSLNPANLNASYGMSVTFTATVASVTSGTPTGTVTFNDGATVLGTGLLSGGVATFTTNYLSTGTDTITARYGGDVHFLPSVSSPLSQVIYTGLSTNNVAAGIINTAPDVFSLSFQGTLGVYYSVVTSTNVTKPMTSWTVVPNSTTLVTDLVAGNWSLTVTNAGPAQYYRAKVAGIIP